MIKFSSKRREIRPIKNDVPIPTETVVRELTVEISPNLSTTAPRIAGIESKKENSAAMTGRTPSNKAVEIVAPEREMPGTTAKPCTIPINKACQIFSSGSLCNFD